MAQSDSEPAKVLLRLPRGLHDQLRATAETQGMSLNTLLVALLAGSIGWTPTGRISAPVRNEEPG